MLTSLIDENAKIEEDVKNLLNNEELCSMFDGLSKLHDQMYYICKNEFENILHNNIKDENTIEHLLDNLLGACNTEKALILYKKICRYYYRINPRASVDYVQFYREMWEEEGNMEELQ